MKTKFILFLGLLLTVSLLKSQSYTMSNGTVLDCSATFFDSGDINSSYNDNEHYIFTICPNAIGNGTSVQFNTFSLGLGDVLCVYSGDTSGTLMGCYTGNELANVEIKSLEACLTFEFISDSAGTDIGWDAVVSCSPFCQAIQPFIATSTPLLDTNLRINLCPGDSIYLEASALFPQNNISYNQSIANSFFELDFGNGDVASSYLSSSVYNQSGIYNLTLEVTDTIGCSYERIVGYVQVSGSPNFNYVGALTNPICYGDSANLLANPVPNTYSSYVSINGDPVQLPDGVGVSYESSLMVNFVDSQLVISNSADISEICLDIEHSWMRDLEIKIVCPNGQSSILHDFAGQTGSQVFLGVPIDNDDPIGNPGVGYTYCWSEASTNSTWINYSNTNNPGTLPSQDYNVFEPFSNLIGCPVLGEWKLVVTDLWAADNGFIFGWNMNFGPNIAQDSIFFSPSIQTILWSENSQIIGQGNELWLTPDSTTNYNLTLTTIDVNGCQFDTLITQTINVNLAPGSFDLTTIQDTCGSQNTASISLNVHDVASPYTVQWSNGEVTNSISNLSTGMYTVTVQDSLGCSALDSAAIVAPANCCNYFISLDTLDCNADTICIALNAIDSVSNGIIGMDFCLTYDTTVFTATGNGSVGSLVYNQPGAEIVLNTNVPGYVFGTIYYNANVPSGTYWNGYGEVACVELVVTSDSANGFYPIGVCAIEESYELIDLAQCATDGGLEFSGSNNLKTQVVYWNYDGVQLSPVKPLKYDNANPSAYLATEMTNSSQSYTVLPDLNGEIVWDLNNGDSVMIVRDILGTYGDTGTACSDVFLVINGFDNYLAALISNFGTNNVNDSIGFWIPSPYQMIAADVNMNDQVRANDNTLIAQRSVRAICEYPQVWNYTNSINPVPTGAGPSLDWRFVDRDITSNSDYQPDAAYPVYFASNATSGYWRDNVPNTEKLMPLNLSDSICPSFQEKTYYGVLLGDIDGNWDYELNAATMKTSSDDHMVFSASPIANSNNYRIKVSYEMANSLASLDFRLNYNNARLNVLQVGNLVSDMGMIMDWNDFDQNTLYLSSYTLNAPQINTPLYYVDVEVLNGQLEISDLESITALLNGNLVSAEVQINETALNVNTESIANQVSVYPNPAMHELNIKLMNVTSEEVNIYLTNSLGQLVFKDKTKSTQYTNTIDVSKLSKGVYNLSVIASGSNYTQKVVIK